MSSVTHEQKATDMIQNFQIDQMRIETEARKLRAEFLRSLFQRKVRR